MGFNEVKELRKSGKIEEALVLAKQDLENKPEDIWCKRSIAWVYYELLKQAVDQENLNHFLTALDNINALQLPNDEHMIFDSVAFTVGKFIFASVNPNESCANLLDNVFSRIRSMSFTRPSEAFSFLHKAFLKASNGWDKYDQFADWWDFDSFRKEDFIEEEFNQRKKMSMVEQVYIHYAKSLMQSLLNGYGQGLNPDFTGLDKMQKIEHFLCKLDDLIAKHPEFVYPPYYKAKLLLTRGGKEQALQAFLPFAKQKKNDFWVWDLLAEIHSSEPDIQFACYCKALSCKIPSEFLVKTRLKFAKMLIEKQLFNEAKTEIDRVIQDREKQGWKISNELSNFQTESWYKNSLARSSNSELYKTYFEKAESLLFSNEPEVHILVTSVNSEKQVLNYAINQTKNGFLKYKGFIKDPEIGQIYDVRFSQIDPDTGFSKIGTIRKSDFLQHEMLKISMGVVKRKEGAPFAFVSDNFIEPDLVEKYNLVAGESINFQAIFTFNRKKNEWGWKVTGINKNV